MYSAITTMVLLSICQSIGVESQCPDIYRRFSSKHTFCSAPNPSCSIRVSGVDSKHIREILALHNGYRNRIARGQENIGKLPQAAEMLQMEWNDELASIAQKHAEQCKFAHDCNQCRATMDFSVGQNLYMSWTTEVNPLPTPNWKAAIGAWYNEVKDFIPSLIPRFQTVPTKGPIGHLTQMIWSRSWKIGCGYVTHMNSGRAYQLYTCNYGPAGNILNEPIYKSGQTCSSCPENTCCGASCASPSNFPGLCKVEPGKIPIYAPRPGNSLLFCNFIGSNCGFGTPRIMKKWQITNTLSGSFVGVVLDGGQSSELRLRQTIPAVPKLCLSFQYRKGPTIAGQPATNSAKLLYKSVESSNEMEYSLTTSRSDFTEFRFTLQFNKEIKIGFKFSVPKGNPSQYFELTDVSAVKGSC